MTERSVFLSALAHDMGASAPIEEIADALEHRELLERLRRLGMDRFRRLEGPLAAHMVGSVRATLERARVAAGDIDAVVYATASYDYRSRHDELSRVCSAVGIVDAVPIGLFQGFCANFTLATLTASNLIRGSGLARCLILTADEWDERFSSRVLQRGATVASDGAASCLLSTEVEQGYRVRSVAHSYRPAAAQLMSQVQTVRYIQHYVEGVTKSCRAALGEAGTTARDCAYLVTGNYNTAIQKNLSELLGIGVERIYAEERASYAHCYAADPMIALERLQLDGRLRPGDAVLISVHGNDIFGAMVVEYVSGQAV